MDIGGTLREAREKRGLSLDQLSRVTKIGIATLRALERNEFASVPGGIFTRGFLRAYANEVGVDAECLVREYVAQFAPPAVGTVPTETEQRVPAPRAAFQSIAAVADALPRPSLIDRLRELNIRSGSLLPATIGFALVIALSAYAMLRGARTPEPTESAAATQVAGAATSNAPAPRSEVGTSGEREATAVAAPAGEGIRIDIQTPALCWVEVLADGKRTAYRLMQPGEQQTIAARDELVLRVGEPAAFTYRLNDVLGKSLGVPGQPTTVRITRDNVREFATE